MEFRLDAGVFTAIDEQIGHINRLVLDGDTQEVSHLVVRKGLIFAEEKVVPIDLIATAAEDRVLLREGVGGLQEFPDFEEEHYTVEVEDAYVPPIGPQGAPPSLSHGPTIMRRASRLFPRRRTVKETERNIPEGTVALEKGAQVITADGKHMGGVERISTFPGTRRVSRLMISEGLLRKERKLLPARWVDRFENGEVHLGVESRALDRVPAHRE